MGRFLFVLFIISLLGYGAFSFTSKKPDVPLKTDIAQVLKGTKGTYAIAAKSLDSNDSFYSNEHTSFTAASLYKLWIMAETYRQIEKGLIKKDDVLSDDVQDLNEKFNIDPAEADLTEGTITMTVSDALSQMITISHNYAALLLSEKIGLSSVSAFLDENGFSESSLGTEESDPTTTASDVALFFEKLYKGKFTNEKYTLEMLDLLKKQTLNDKLPKNLPKGTVIAHKTGEIGSFSHDGGIVYSPSGDYIIVVLTKTDIPAAANDRIADISKVVYEYFTKGGENDNG